MSLSTPASRSFTALPCEHPVANASRESHPDITEPGHHECFITRLSTELVYHIIDFVPPESHLDFARTCKRIADCSSNVLRRHQEAYNKYRVASDISPITIPTLLRSAFGRADPLIVWHVRSIEIWYDRASWLDWKPLHFNSQLHEENMEVDSISWKWQDDEFSKYVEDLEDQFDAMLENGDEDIRTEAREQFEDGADGILKSLLIAYCPRLRDVKFITQEHRAKSTLDWLKRLIQGSILHGGHWPLGLCNIQEAAVGVESETWMSTQHQNADLDGSDKSMEVFSVLLRLPRLHSIYYNKLKRSGWDDETDYNSPTLMPLHSSTVKHIFLDDCSDMPYKFRIALFEAPLALETFTLRAGECDDRMDDADALVQGLCSEQASSLHTLMFYGPYTFAQIHGYRCSVYRNEELEKAHNLKTVAIHVSDVELDCFYSMGSATDQQDDKISYEEQRKYFVKWFRETAFPSTIERLVLWGRAEEYYLTQCEGKFLDWIEDALIAVISSHRWLEGCDADESDDSASNASEAFYPHLKAIYLEDIERDYKGSRHMHDGPRTNTILFQKLIQVGKEAGIDVHTLTNRTPARHAHDFPTAPDRYDLRSGPWWERRSEAEEWVFDVYKGRKVPPGCGKCGRCETCSAEYSEQLWRSLDG